MEIPSLWFSSHSRGSRRYISKVEAFGTKEIYKSTICCEKEKISTSSSACPGKTTVGAFEEMAVPALMDQELERNWDISTLQNKGNWKRSEMIAKLVLNRVFIISTGEAVQPKITHTHAKMVDCNTNTTSRNPTPLSCSLVVSMRTEGNAYTNVWKPLNASVNINRNAPEIVLPIFRRLKPNLLRNQRCNSRWLLMYF